tara:strand:+ start:359 stop:1246 length:888 start_codon:yes stop_codon:yes gene_type:complete
MTTDPQDKVTFHRTLFECQLNQIFKTHLDQTPPLLKEAIKYSSLNAGKRIRALLVYGIGEVFGANLQQLHAPACAVELIHAYSLVHDDLPAMDNSPLRRGKPACHIVYGDAIAVLVGDALQSIAFEILSQSKFISDKQRLENIHELSQACGANGMVGGQVLDIHAEGISLNLTQLAYLHQLKTGKLIEASAVMGAQIANVDAIKLLQIRKFAQHLGLAFQIQDDLLDAQGNEKQLGKPCHDQANQKNTYTELLGIALAQEKLQHEITAATNILQEIAPQTHWVHELMHAITVRQY